LKSGLGLLNLKSLTAWWESTPLGKQAAWDSSIRAHDRIRHRRNLWLLVSLMSVGCVIPLLLILLTPPLGRVRADEVGVVAAAVIMLLAAGLAYLLARWRSVETAAFVYLCTLTFVIAIGDSPHEVAAGRTLVVFALPILAAGAVLPAWTPFVFAAFSSLVVMLVGSGQVEPLSYLISGLTFFGLAGISWLNAASLARYNGALHAANLHLRQRESDFRLLFADNPLPMVLVDLQTFQVIEGNQAALAQSGYNRAELLNYQIGQWLPFQSSESVAAILRGETVHKEQQYQIAGGRIVYVALTVHRIVYGSQPVALVIGQDITARWQAEEALRTLNTELEQRVEERTAELRQVNGELERSNRHKDEFLATMSHELRTPLTGILGSAEVLSGEQMGQLNAKQTRAVQLIQESGEHLLALINSVLDLSRLEAGRLTIDIEPVLLRDVCLGALHMVQPHSKSKSQIVTFSSTPDNFWLHADVRRLKQILINLLGNAVKFTPENGSIRLEVQADFAEATVSFCVTDNGIGIAADDLPRLFEPFYQANRGLNRLYGGAGLGLTLVQRLAQLHGGSVEVISAPGEGSRFTVLLPCRPQPLAPVLPAAPAKTSMSIPNLALSCGQRPAVLLAEDHTGSVEVLRSLLEMAGCDLTVVGRGDDAVEKVTTTHFDLVLMDVQMPGMDGLSAIRGIRRLPDAAAHTPIIALTAMALWGDRERCLEAGANDYISKPIDLDRLFAAMQTQFGADQAAAPQSATSPT
jgi:PAS domain S-box-containing protein